MIVDLIKGCSSDVHLYLWSVLKVVAVSKRDGCICESGSCQLLSELVFRSVAVLIRKVTTGVLQQTMELCRSTGESTIAGNMIEASSLGP